MNEWVRVSVVVKERMNEPFSSGLGWIDRKNGPPSCCTCPCRYHIGLRYTGGARLLLLVSLKFGLVPITVPVAVRGLDLDAEVWVKLRLVPQPPFVGTATWAFVTQPKIKLALAPFRLLNVMGV